ncbi:ComF family protein [Propionivibrio limicola]|uniref:ComF family protein n=1 Tax=Propionivibrio limicola TaxID=167645 RepID=UPI001FE8835A|nr:ComF family protein [Propionivibrio limicola]
MGATYWKRGKCKTQKEKPESRLNDGGVRGMCILTQNKGLLSAPGLARLFNALAPQSCLLCASTSRHAPVCEACTADLPKHELPACPRCAQPTPAGELCGQCLAHPPHYDSTRAAFLYDFPLDKLVQALKYAHRLAIADYLGQQMACTADGICADLIIPLPLHLIRLRERGFNQALELARPISRSHNLQIDTTSCVRLRHTAAQATLPWRDRKENIRNAFYCSTDLTGKRILLVDDVMTTGSSLNECARTLKLHGASAVTVLVAARALAKR